MFLEHQVRLLPHTKGLTACQMLIPSLNVRDVICLCTGCLHGDSPCKYSDYVDEWRGFDMNTHKPSDVDLTLWKSVKIRKCVSSREDYAWEDVHAILQSYTDYDEALEYVKKIPCHSSTAT